jgi:hypothetical protein
VLHVGNFWNRSLQSSELIASSQDMK